MSMTDPIADMLTRIRNAYSVRKPKVDVPASKVKKGIARVLKDEGYIKDFVEMEDSVQGSIRIYLKYGPDNEDIIREIKRASRPGRRVYVGVDEIPVVLDGLGTAVLSTPKGILSDRECRRDRVGGEVVCVVW